MKHLLLIEDNPEIRENTAEILELSNYRVTTAENGKSGVEKAMAEKPDLIICDVMMPVLDGYGVLHLLNKNPALSGIPFIFLTAKTERADFRKGMDLGADDYVTKPFTDVELLTAVERRLSKVAAMQKSIRESEALFNTENINNDPHALQKFVKDRHQNHYKRKQLIYSEGNHPSRLYYIEKGKVKTYKTNSDGKDLTIDLHSEGDFIGYNALLDQTVYQESAEAIDDTTVAIIPREEFETLLGGNMNVARQFIRMLAKNVSQKEEQLLGLAYNSLRKRVADALVLLQRKYQKPGEEKFSIHISREDLANIAGTATESLIRTLSDFKSEKLIEIKDGFITIQNQKKLENMLN
jgi:CRP-like cAMP-binding protein